MRALEPEPEPDPPAKSVARHTAKSVASTADPPAVGSGEEEEDEAGLSDEVSCCRHHDHRNENRRLIGFVQSLHELPLK
eukprot:COSAG06_NODE_2456_length_6848_cov_66.970959_5_plen_79_part_00